MTQVPKTIKEILLSRKGWNAFLAKSCKSTRPYISNLVNDEKFTSGHWDKIEQYAREIDPQATEERMNYLKSSIEA